MINDTDILQRLPECFNTQAHLVNQARRLRTTFMLGVGDAHYRITIAGGGIESVKRGPFLMDEWDFSLQADADVWQKFWLPVPPPGFHDVMALSKSKRLSIQGDLYPLMSHLLYFKALLATVRGMGESK